MWKSEVWLKVEEMVRSEVDGSSSKDFERCGFGGVRSRSAKELIVEK